ncbi:hypothetical protein [Roseiterribacter gracilis]|uniref:DUF4214 domain-containing protein n=1 Tax=Roseiterribacter gracilis TaxID=2812848 RepID=A0A8S8XH04_9PROT|nr:hypothetical protein TMPK1_40410 [Rhodospirillales bacterium TMPK1]
MTTSISSDGLLSTLLRWPGANDDGGSDTPTRAQDGGANGFGDAYSLDVDTSAASALADAETAIASGDADALRSAYARATDAYVSRYGAISGQGGDAADQLTTDLVRIGVLSAEGGHTALGAVQAVLQNDPASAKAALIQALLDATQTDQAAAPGNQYDVFTPEEGGGGLQAFAAFASAQSFSTASVTSLPPEQIQPWSGPNSFGNGNLLAISQENASAQTQWYNIEVAVGPLYYQHQPVDFTSQFSTLLNEYEAKFGSLAASQFGAAQFIQDLESLDMIGASNASSLFSSFQTAWNSGASEATLKQQLASNASAAVNSYVPNPVGGWQSPGTTITPLPAQTGSQPGSGGGSSGGSGTTLPPQVVLPWSGPNTFGDGNQLGISQTSASAKAQWYNIEVGIDPLYHQHQAVDFSGQFQTLLGEYETKFGSLSTSQLGAAQFIQDLEALVMIGASNASSLFSSFQSAWNSGASAATLKSQLANAASAAVNSYIPNPVGGWQSPGTIITPLPVQGGSQPVSPPPPPPPPPPVTVPPPPPPPPATVTLQSLATDYLSGLYTTVLGRAPDTAGLTTQRDAFVAFATTNGIAAAEKQFATQFVNSSEGVAYSNAIQAATVPPPPPPPPDVIGNFATQFIGNLYVNVLGRSADAGGLATQVAAFRSYAAAGGISAAEINIASQIAHSSEAQQHNAVDGASFLTSLYLDELGRAPDSAGLTVQLNAFNAEVASAGIAAAESDFAAAFANSGEGQAHSAALQAAANYTPPTQGVNTAPISNYASQFLSKLYDTVLGRPADASGLATQVAAFTSYAVANGIRAAQVQFASNFADSAEAIARDAGISTVPVDDPARTAAKAFLSDLYKQLVGHAAENTALEVQATDFLSYANAHGQAAAKTEFQARIYNSTEATTFRGQQLSSGQGASLTIRDLFAATSPETTAVNKARATVAANYLISLYGTVLGRSADAGGLKVQTAAFISFAKQNGFVAAEDEFYWRFKESREYSDTHGHTYNLMLDDGDPNDGSGGDNTGGTGTGSDTPRNGAAPSGSHIPGLTYSLAGSVVTFDSVGKPLGVDGYDPPDDQIAGYAADGTPLLKFNPGDLNRGVLYTLTPVTNDGENLPSSLAPLLFLGGNQSLATGYAGGQEFNVASRDVSNQVSAMVSIDMMRNGVNSNLGVADIVLGGSTFTLRTTAEGALAVLTDADNKVYGQLQDGRLLQLGSIDSIDQFTANSPLSISAGGSTVIYSSDGMVVWGVRNASGADTTPPGWYNPAADGTIIFGNVAGPAVSTTPRPLDKKFINFFDKQSAAIMKVAGQLGVDPSLLFGLSAFETGWGASPQFNNLNNPFGATPGGQGSTPVTYNSFDSAWQNWANQWGSRVEGVGGDVDRFISALLVDNRGVPNTDNRGSYNTETPNYAQLVKNTILSVPTKLNQWASANP